MAQMTRRDRARRWGALALLAALALWTRALPLAAQEAGETVVRRGAVAENLYLAGREVDVQADVDGDVVAAGGRVTVGKVVKRDVIAAGGLVEIEGRVLDDVRAAGGEVTVAGEVGGDLVLAGGRVRLTPETRVGGRAFLAGGTVEVPGTLARGLRAAGGTIVLSGRIDGDVRLAGERIEIRPTARIGGALTYWSPRQATIDPAAQIAGPVTRHEVGLRGPAAAARRVAWAARILFLLGLMVAGVVLVALLPDFALSAARTIGTEPWASLGLGFALLAAVPLAAILLMATVVGIPLALAVVALYLVSLLVGFLVAALFLGDLGARLLSRPEPPSRGVRILALVLALVVLWLVRPIPFAGAVVLFLALLFGLGAWAIRAYRAYVGARAAA